MKGHLYRPQAEHQKPTLKLCESAPTLSLTAHNRLGVWAYLAPSVGSGADILSGQMINSRCNDPHMPCPAEWFLVVATALSDSRIITSHERQWPSHPHHLSASRSQRR